MSAELLFKLKKNGETVGYCKLFEYGLLFSRDLAFDAMHNTPELPHEVEGEGLTYHPFLRKEQLFGLGGVGRDIFVGDSVKRLLNEVGTVDEDGKVKDGLYTDEIELVDI